ncbi:MAG: condensation domain-containing protein [Gammaproteobacteria bacterium]|nr:condensation domain-containing protein [Gammaproteobacteria bacterium]
MLQIPFNILDEGFTHGDDPTQPPTVQIEARVAGCFDDGRLRQAMGVALNQHPLARARLEPWTDETVTYEWLIDDVPQVDPMSVVAAATDADVDRIRSELQSHPVSIFESPPLRARLVHRQGGDYLMLAIHHAASDGMGALRLLQSVLRAYANVDDPQPQLDPLDVHRLPVPEFEPGIAELWHAARMEFERFARMGSFPEHLPPQGATARAGYGIQSIHLPLAPISSAPLRTELGASVNDLLITAATLACARWIETHADAVPDRITVTMPINARPKEWRNEVVGNFVTADVVSTSAEERTSARDCLASVAGWTDAVKRVGPGPALAALAAIPSGPVSGRRAFAQWASQAGARFADTTVLSNLGRVNKEWLDTDQLEITELWFSPPTSLPTGLGLGAIATTDRLFLSLRHSWRLWSSEATAQFADTLVTALDEICT